MQIHKEEIFMCKNQSEKYRKLRGKLQDAVEEFQWWLEKSEKSLTHDFGNNKDISVREKVQRYGLLLVINKIHIEFSELDQLTITCETRAGTEIQTTIFEYQENKSFMWMLKRIENDIKKAAKGQNMIPIKDIDNVFNRLRDAIQQFSKI